jgi:hypothetical protein
MTNGSSELEGPSSAAHFKSMLRPSSEVAEAAPPTVSRRSFLASSGVEHLTAHSNHLVPFGRLGRGRGGGRDSRLGIHFGLNLRGLGRLQRSSRLQRVFIVLGSLVLGLIDSALHALLLLLQ